MRYVLCVPVLIMCIISLSYRVNSSPCDEDPVTKDLLSPSAVECQQTDDPDHLVTWDAPRTLSGSYIVPAGETLEIGPGTVVTFSTSYSRLVIQRGATLIAAGTSDDPITFRAADADSWWGGIVIENGASLGGNRLEWLNINHAEVGLRILADDVTVSHCTVDGCSGMRGDLKRSPAHYDVRVGVEVNGSGIVVRDCTVSTCTWCIDVNQGRSGKSPAPKKVIITGCTIGPTEPVTESSIKGMDAPNGIHVFDACAVIACNSVHAAFWGIEIGRSAVSVIGNQLGDNTAYDVTLFDPPSDLRLQGNSPVGKPGNLRMTARTRQPGQPESWEPLFNNYWYSLAGKLDQHEDHATLFSNELRDRLISYWPAEGSAKDWLGASNGLLVGAKYGYGRGRVGLAFALHPGAYMQVARLSSNFPTGNEARTVCFWFRTIQDFGADTESALLQYGSPVNGEMFGLITSRNAPRKLYFWGYWTGRVWLENDLPGVTDLAEGWHHAAVTYDGKIIRLYLDGKLEAEKGIALNTVLNPQYGLSIGLRWDTSPPIGWTGWIDEVAVFGRALLPDEIQKIYAAGLDGDWFLMSER